MLQVSGADQALIARICAHLPDEPHQVVSELTFETAYEARADTLLLVEGTALAASLDGLVRAANAPGVARVLVVTSRAEDDDELARLRRSGARYAILRAPRVVDVEALRGKRVLVPREVASAPFTTPDELARHVADLVRDRERMGVTVEVPPSGLAALEAAGARPRVVAPWRAKVGRWLNQPVLAAAG